MGISKKDKEDKGVEVSSKRRSNLRLKIEKWWDEHPTLLFITLLLVLFIVGVLGWAFGGGKSPSWQNIANAYHAQLLESFDGRQERKGALTIYSDLKDFDRESYNAFDVMATTLYLSAVTMKNHYRQIIQQRKGRVRALVLDPRLVVSGESNNKFNEFAKYWKITPEEFLAKCWLSTRALAGLQQELGKNFQVRVYDTAQPEAVKGQFIIGRSYQKYSLTNPWERFDVIVPYENESYLAQKQRSRPYWRMKNRFDDEKVKKYTSSFEKLWEQSILLEEVLATFTLEPQLLQRNN